MAMQSKQPKKLTKKQSMENVVKHYNNSLKENFIKNMIIGFETASQLYLDKIENGCSLEELKEFIKKNLESKEVIGKVALNNVEKD